MQFLLIAYIGSRCDLEFDPCSLEITSENKKEKEMEDGKKEEKDDSMLKAKRKRKKKYKERLKIEEEVIPLRVLSK